MQTNAITKHVLFLLFLTSTLFSGPLFAALTLPEFYAKYTVEKHGSSIAEATYQLSHTDTGYKFSQNTHLVGLASLLGNDTVSATSIINEINNHLLLTKHEYIQTGRKKNRNEVFDIQWHTDTATVNGEINGIVRNKIIHIETQSKVWDSLSFQVPLMIAANKNVKEYPYNAILKGKLNSYNFILKSTKKISYADVEYEALQMVRTDPHKDKQLHIWLIPKLNNIPILIETFRKGKEDTRLQLYHVQFNNEGPLKKQTTYSTNDDEF